jgi:ABC-type phosphate transport system substrate-binding protein
MRALASIAIVVILPWVALAQTNSGAVPAYRVITYPKNATGNIDRAFVADAFLKKTTRWRDGEVIRPVDLPSDSLTRRRFSEEVLSRSVAAVRSYWQQLIFSGRDLPPPELESEAAVVQYVLTHPGAVGYVSGATDTGTTKVLNVK